MSLIHCLKSDPWDEIRHHPVLFDQDFGMGLHTSDLFHPPFYMRSGYFPPWKHDSESHGGISDIQADKDNFKVMIDVQHFAPDELTVKTVDNYLVVEGKHEEKKDEHGYISRHFLRRYKLPEGVKEESVTSDLSSDGVLCISAPMV
ncbi:hypothetical protein J437_LFUL012994 [Ladona fulva]|uniref:SHSP domain-containing protein n=1 Tax=Ladona fulva TaxID=123851 RepID=A0A8K0KCM9_LADFU|nr:hypothetical protein J437_LFUL012994 [Ladona fulva]